MRIGKGTPRATPGGSGEKALQAALPLAKQGVRGAIWQGIAQIVGKGVVLLTTIVLARLLSPEEFGLVALALVVMSYAETLADAGVAQSLVYLPRTKETVRSALLVSMLVGGTLTAAAIAGAPLIAEFFGRQELVPLVKVLAVALLAAALWAVPESLLRRELLFKRLTFATVIRAAITGAVAMVLALAGYGAWSLAIGTAAGAVSYAIACWLLLPERISWKFWLIDSESLKANLAYGTPIAGSNLLARLVFDLDYLIVGRLLGAQALGYYTMAFRLPELLIINVFFVLSTVLFPLYSRVRDDRSRLREGYLRSVQIQSLYGVTAGVGLAIVAPTMIPTLFGEQWIPVVLPLAFLSLYAAARSLGAGANDVYKAIGRPSLSIWISVIRLVVLIPVLLLATRWGIVGVAIAQLGVTLLFSGGMQMVAAKVIGVTGLQILRAMLPGLCCGTAIAISGVAIQALPWGNQVLLTAIVVVAGLVVTYATLRLVFSRTYKDLFQLFVRR